MGRLDNKVAIITGGARGQGAAEARLFGDEGATVVVTDVLDDVGGEFAAGIGAEFLHHDVSSEDDWAAVVADVIDHHGQIDILINNAGILHGSRLVNYQTADWDRVIAVNQTGVFLGMRAVAQSMIDGGGGSIVNISSVAGLEATFASMAYSASKWAVRGMTKVAALELGRNDIRVNSIHPGLIETDMTTDFDLDRMLRAVPLGRSGQPVDIANMALFLAADESGYCSGQEFTVDGGMHK